MEGRRSSGKPSPHNSLYENEGDVMVRCCRPHKVRRDLCGGASSGVSLRRDQVSQPGGRSSGSVGEGRRGPGWGGSAEEVGSAAGLKGGVWEGAGVCNGVGGGRSGRGRLDVGTMLKGEAITGNGLGGE